MKDGENTTINLRPAPHLRPMQSFASGQVKAYIAGKITGLDLQTAYRNFLRAADYLIKMGIEVVNPAEFVTEDADRPYHEYMREDIARLVECNAIALLPNWKESKGACFEAAVARMCGLMEIRLPEHVLDHGE